MTNSVTVSWNGHQLSSIEEVADAIQSVRSLTDAAELTDAIFALHALSKITVLNFIDVGYLMGQKIIEIKETEHEHIG
jgi:hypothetical protein